jgi:quercetin 2,3-dioxygenase
VSLFSLKISEGGIAELSFLESYNTGILIVEGDIKVNRSRKARGNQFIFLLHNGGKASILKYFTPAFRSQFVPAKYGQS